MILIVKVEDLMVGDPLRHENKHRVTRVRKITYP